MQIEYFSATKILKHLFWEMYSISLNTSTLDTQKNFLIHKNESQNHKNASQN